MMKSNLIVCCICCIVAISFLKHVETLQIIDDTFVNNESQRENILHPRVPMKDKAAYYNNENNVNLKRKFLSQVYAVVVVSDDLPEVATGTIGIEKRVIDFTTRAALATAKVRNFRLNQKANLVQQQAAGRSRDIGGLGKPAEVLLEYQDSLGQYSFGYSAPESARSEVRSADGSTRGAFSYVDNTGVIQTAKYIADSENGFRIEASNLPQAPSPVEETPEVKAARLEHLLAYEAAVKDVENQQKQEICDSCKDNEGEQKLVKSLSKQSTMEVGITEKQENSSVKQLPQDTMPLKIETAGLPFVQTSFILPSSNLNLQNRIELKTTDLSSTSSSAMSTSQDAGKQDMAMKEDEHKKDELKPTQISQTQHHQLYSSSPIVSIPSYRIPVYSYNQHLQFIPSFYYY